MKIHSSLNLNKLLLMPVFCLFCRTVKMKIAVIGQSLFGQEVYKELRKDGHTIVGVFTIPDKDGKADPLGKNFSWTWAELCPHHVSKILM